MCVFNSILLYFIKKYFIKINNVAEIVSIANASLPPLKPQLSLQSSCAEDLQQQLGLNKDAVGFVSLLSPLPRRNPPPHGPRRPSPALTGPHLAHFPLLNSTGRDSFLSVFDADSPLEARFVKATGASAACVGIFFR